MKTDTFRKKLQKEIFLSSTLMILFVVLGLGVGFFIFYYVNNQIQLKNERERISNSYLQMVTTFENKMKEQEKNLFLAYMEGEVSEREIYSAYYNFTSKESLRARLLLLDSQKNLIFDSEGENNPNKQLGYYLSIVNNRNNDSDFLQRVYLSMNTEHYLVLVDKIYRNKEVKGYGVYLINGNDFLQESSTNGIQYILFDKHNNVFARSSSMFLNGSLEKIDSIILNESFTYKKQKYYTQYEEINDNIRLVVYKQVDSLSILLFILFIVIVIFGSALLLQSNYFSRKIASNNAKSIVEISKEMVRVKSNIHHRFKIETGDEFQLLAQNINNMLDEIEVLHNNNLQLIHENAISEKKKLEAQFNPHFLYNTLEAIRASIYFDKELANKLILNLNTILRYSIAEDVLDATVEGDIKYLESYLEINKSRFGHFTYSIEVDETALEYSIPKLFLLPVLENSIKYGFQSRKDLWILIEVKKISDTRLFFRVKDNGGGIDNELLARINSKEYSNIKNHHGLYNSKRRVMLMYPKSTFQVKSHQNFTIVEIIIEMED